MTKPYSLAENSAFSKKTSNLQLAWDTVSTGALKTCARYYQLTVVEGWTPKTQSVHLYFGLLIHSCREAYDHAIAKGDKHDKALKKAVRCGLEKSGERQLVAICSHCGAINSWKTENEASICLECNGKSLRVEERFFPWQSDDKYKNRPNLIRTIVWYLDHYKDSEEKTVIMADGKPAVELWFRFELPLQSKGGEKFFLTGHIDRLVELAAAFWFFDIKTSKNTISSSFFEQFSPNNQMSLYNAGGKVTLDKPLMGGVIDAIQVAVGFTRCQRGIIQQTPGLMDEWIKDIQYWLKQAEKHALDNYWPMNDTACHHYGGCDFKGICNKDPAVRKVFLETHFKRKLWDPLKERTD